MHDSNLIIVEDANNPAIYSDLFSTNHRNIGIFEENEVWDTSYLDS